MKTRPDEQRRAASGRSGANLEVLAVVECALPVPHALSDLRKGAGQVRGVEVVQGRLVEA